MNESAPRVGWTTTTLGPHVKLQTGKLDVNAGSEDGRFPFFTCSRETYKIDVAAFSGKSVIVAGNGDLNVKYFDGEFNAYQRTYVLQVADEGKLDARYLFYFMDDYVSTLRANTQGSTIQYLKKAQFTDAPINLPPLSGQRRIVNVMASVEEYIAALQQQADDARSARNGVLHELLTAVGDDWAETTLGALITLEYGKPLKAEDRDGQGFPVFGSAGEVGLHSIPLIARAPVIVVGRKGTAGSVWWSSRPCSVIDTAYYVTERVELEARFLFLLLSFLDLPSLTAQTGVPGLNRDRAYACAVAIPSLNEQKRIVEVVTAMDDVISTTEQAIAHAKLLRSGLLSDLLSGEHEIPEAYDRLLGAA